MDVNLVIEAPGIELLVLYSKYLVDIDRGMIDFPDFFGGVILVNNF